MYTIFTMHHFQSIGYGIVHCCDIVPIDLDFNTSVNIKQMIYFFWVTLSITSRSYKVSKILHDAARDLPFPQYLLSILVVSYIVVYMTSV